MYLVILILGLTLFSESTKSFRRYGKGNTKNTNLQTQCLNQKCECAKVNPENRIIRGFFPKPCVAPYQVFIKVLNKRCGGTILNRRYILTAGHCLYTGHHLTTKLTVGDIKIIVGQNNICRTRSENKEIFLVDQIIENPSYNITRRKIQGDIALLRLQRDMKFSCRVKPACLPCNSKKMYARRRGFVTGWGGVVPYPIKEYHTVKQKTPCTLKGTCLRILDRRNASCKKQTNGIPDKTKLCAFGHGTSACQGDSGGPLVVSENGMKVLVGVVSYAEGCADDRYPGVFTRVSAYMDWITDNIADGWCQ